MVGGDAPSGHLIWNMCAYMSSGLSPLAQFALVISFLSSVPLVLFIHSFIQSMILGGLQFILPAISPQSLPEAFLIDLALSGLYWHWGWTMCFPSIISEQISVTWNKGNRSGLRCPQWWHRILCLYRFPPNQDNTATEKGPASVGIRTICCNNQCVSRAKVLIWAMKREMYSFQLKKKWK